MERWEMILSSTNKELDVVTYIREHLPENGELDLAALLQDVQKRESTPSDVREGDSCFEMMALAESVMGCLHDDLSGLDDEKKGMGQHQKSQSITSFTAGKKDILRLRDYLCDSLYYARKYIDQRPVYTPCRFLLFLNVGKGFINRRVIVALAVIFVDTHRLHLLLILLIKLAFVSVRPELQPFRPGRRPSHLFAHRCNRHPSVGLDDNLVMHMGDNGAVF